MLLLDIVDFSLFEQLDVSTSFLNRIDSSGDTNPITGIQGNERSASELIVARLDAPSFIKLEVTATSED